MGSRQRLNLGVHLDDFNFSIFEAAKPLSGLGRRKGREGLHTSGLRRRKPSMHASWQRLQPFPAARRGFSSASLPAA
eukprot:533017-Pelagomonas_calceolata.AAC.6